MSDYFLCKCPQCGGRVKEYYEQPTINKEYSADIILKNNMTLKGTYCTIVIDNYAVITNDFLGLSFNGFWQEVGSVSSTASDKEIIGNTICNNPNELRLKKKPITLDIIHDWILWKDSGIRIAKCFLADKGQISDPLFKEKENNIIDEFLYDYIWLETSLYETYWRLINIKGNIILKRLNSTFKSNVELMQEMIKESLNEEFYTIRHSKFYQYNPKLDKKLHLLSCQKNLSPSNHKLRESLKYLVYPHLKNAILNKKVNAILNDLDKEGDIFVTTHLKVISEIIIGLIKLKIKTHCNPKLQKYKLNQHNWINGCKK